MKKLTNELEPEENSSIDNLKTPVADTGDLENLLAGYTEAATETPDPETINVPYNLPPAFVPPAVAGQWQGNPLYYQTGKKAGQLRPTGTKPKVDFQHNNTPTTISGEIISGALFMTMIDLLLPLLFVAANNYFSKVKIKSEDLELTAKQKSELAPIADKVAAQVRLTANPTVVLVFTLAGIYGLNFMKAKMLAEAKIKIKPSQDAHK